MVLRADKLRLKRVLLDAISLLCRSSLAVESGFSIDATIGITLGEDEVVLVSFRELVQPYQGDHPLDDVPVPDNASLDPSPDSNDFERTHQGGDRNSDAPHVDKLNQAANTLEDVDSEDLSQAEGVLRRESIGRKGERAVKRREEASTNGARLNGVTTARNIRRKLNSDITHAETDVKRFSVHTESNFQLSSSGTSLESSVEKYPTKVAASWKANPNYESLLVKEELLDEMKEEDVDDGDGTYDEDDAWVSCDNEYNSSFRSYAETDDYDSTLVHDSNVDYYATSSMRDITPGEEGGRLSRSQKLGGRLGGASGSARGGSSEKLHFGKKAVEQDVILSQALLANRQNLDQSQQSSGAAGSGQEGGAVVCSVCGARLSSAATLLKHIKGTHLALSQCRCDVCGEQFKWTMQLCRHRRRFHAGAAPAPPEWAGGSTGPPEWTGAAPGPPGGRRAGHRADGWQTSIVLD